MSKRAKNTERSVGFSGEDNYINSIVGEGTHFRGHLHLSGLLRIDGDFSGSIVTAGKVLVGKNGRADCTIEANTVVVGGILRGAIYATEKVIVLASAMVLGNIHAPRLIAEEGVLIDGRLIVRQGAPQTAAAAADSVFPSHKNGEEERRIPFTTPRRTQREQAVGFRDGSR